MCPLQFAKAWLLALSPVATPCWHALSNTLQASQAHLWEIAVHLGNPMGADPKQPYIARIACSPNVQATSNHNHGSFLFQCIIQVSVTATHVCLPTGVNLFSSQHTHAVMSGQVISGQKFVGKPNAYLEKQLRSLMLSCVYVRRLH